MIMPIPVELITEILLRLPAKSLLRFKIVCKLWYNLIISTDFVNLHLERSIATQTNLHFVYKTPILHLGDFDTFDNSIPLEHPFKESNVDVVGSCNGLLCLHRWVVNDSNESNCFLLIYNPTTQTYTTPPLLPTSSVFTPLTNYYGFGYESITQDYRCVSIISGFNEEKRSFECYVMVYSLKEGSWRKPAIPSVPYDIDDYDMKSMFLNDAIHWDYGLSNTEKRLPIVSFNIRDGCFSTLPVPNLDSMDANACSMFVGVLDGNLCLAVSDMFFDTYTDLWVMKEYGTAESWVKLFSVAKHNGSDVVSRPIGYSMNNKELFVQTVLLQVASIDLDTKEISYVKSANFSQCMDAHVCVENLLMLRG